jgi:cytochrome oxidase assembly protein ShyY1
MSRYRFALGPKWILSHLFVLALVITMVNLGFWQLRRLDEKKDRNRRITSRSVEPVRPIGQVLTAGHSFADATRVEFRRVTMTGRYRSDQELLVRSRSLDSTPGSWVLTPLVMADGTAAVVNRGWIANEGRFDAVPRQYKAPSGEVTVTGLIRLTETRGAFGPKDPLTGRLSNLARADIARFQKQVPERLVPAWVQLQRERPKPSGFVPRLLPAPELTEGPHLSYAIQWFIFSSIAVIGYPLILRRRARELARGDEDDDFDPTLDHPDHPDPLDPLDPARDPIPGTAVHPRA